MATASRLTYDDLFDIPAAREGDRHELFEGGLVVTPSPASRHQFIVGNLQFALESHVRRHALGKVVANLDVLLSPNTVLVPDLMFIAADRVGIIGSQYVGGPPDFVVEVLSPGTSRRDRGAKRDLYARYGVREYWILDPDAKSVEALVLEDGAWRSTTVAEGVVRSLAVPGFAVPVEEIFAGV